MVFLYVWKIRINGIVYKLISNTKLRFTWELQMKINNKNNQKKNVCYSVHEELWGNSQNIMESMQIEPPKNRTMLESAIGERLHHDEAFSIWVTCLMLKLAMVKTYNQVLQYSSWKTSRDGDKNLIVNEFTKMLMELPEELLTFPTYVLLLLLFRIDLDLSKMLESSFVIPLQRLLIGNRVKWYPMVMTLLVKRLLINRVPL